MQVARCYLLLLGVLSRKFNRVGEPKGFVVKPFVLPQCTITRMWRVLTKNIAVEPFPSADNGIPMELLGHPLLGCPTQRIS